MDTVLVGTKGQSPVSIHPFGLRENKLPQKVVVSPQQEADQAGLTWVAV